MRREVLTNQLALRHFVPAFQLSFARGKPLDPGAAARRSGDAPPSRTRQALPRGRGSSFRTPPLDTPCSQGRRSPLPLHPLAAVGSTRDALRLPGPSGQDPLNRRSVLHLSGFFHPTPNDLAPKMILRMASPFCAARAL